MPWPIPTTETRSRATLERHYTVERELADRLRQAGRDERRRLYGPVYDELFQRLGDLPKTADDPAAQAQFVALQATLLAPFLQPDTVFLELGAGDGALAAHLAPRLRRAIAVDASAVALAGVERPPNLEVVVSDAIPLELASASVDVAYSCHFLEHLHPEDAREHLAEVHRVLRPGGAYLIVTPSRIWGPHDVSRYFNDTPRGLHLHETTHGELARWLRQVGFRRTRALRGVGVPPRQVAVAPLALAEALLNPLPAAMRRWLLEQLARGYPAPFRPLEQVKVVGFA